MRWTLCQKRIQETVMVVLHLLLLLAPLLNGCTDENGSTEAGKPDGMAPVASIIFPGITALLTSGRVTVRGTAQGQHAITGVAVNGVPATSTDGFATWEATLALPPGTSSLIVSTEDVLGHTDMAAAQATITVVSFLGSPRGVAVEATGQLVVAETQHVMRVDPGSGATTVVSDVTTGSGPPFGALAGLAVEATGQLVVVDNVMHAQAGRVVRVDPSTGTRTVVSDATPGNEPPFAPLPGLPAGSTLAGIAVEATGQLVVVEVVKRLLDVIFQFGRVVRVDPSSGVRTVVSDVSTNDSVLFSALQGIAVEATGQLVVIDIAQSMEGFLLKAQVVRVDPSSGARAVVSSTTTGSGPLFDALRSIAVEATGQLVVVDDEGALDRVLRVDPRSGARTIVTEAPFVSILSIAVEATGQLVAANQNFPVGVLRVDPSSGVHTVVSDRTTGSGPPFGLPRSIAVEATGQLVVVEADELSRGRIMRVDPSSGARTIVSGATTGSGPSFDAPLGLVVEATGQLVVMESQRVLRVDPSSGARTIIADATIGNGLPFGSLVGIAVEATGEFVVVDAVFNAVLRVDARSGDRTMISR